jgi:hypothetical protein
MSGEPRQQGYAGLAKKFAFGGTILKLIPEMRSSAPDTGEKQAYLFLEFYREF